MYRNKNNNTSEKGSKSAKKECRLKEINKALNNTSIIKSEGDNAVKFQLGIIGYAKASNGITESEFNKLVEPLLKDNHFLDFYSFRAEADMLLKRTPLEICQALDKELSSDDDYNASKILFMARLKGIDYEALPEINFESLHNNELSRDVAQAQKKLMLEVLAHSGTHPSTQNFENHSEEKLPPLPEVLNNSLEVNSPQPSNEPTIIKEHQKKSEFVAIMEELIPEKKKNKMHINAVQPISLETIMQASLEKSIALSEGEIFKLNYKAISKIHEASTLALHKMQEQFKKSYSIDGSSTYEEMARSCDASKKDRDENLKKPVPCKLTGQPLVQEYYKIGEVYLINKEKRIVRQQDNLKFNKKDKCAEFDNLKPQYHGLNDSQIKKKRDEIYRTMEEALNKDLEKTKKQQALWLGEKTFTQNVEKNRKIKQEKVPFPEKELDFRNLVLDFNSNSASKGKTIHVYQDGVYLVSNKKAEPSKIPQISNARAPHKSCITGLSSSSANFYKEHNTKEKNPKQTVGMALGS